MIFYRRSSGYNAARDLLGLPPRPYEQAAYTTCLDLGGWGAVVTFGWDRKVILKLREEAKKFKQLINTKLIYPPQGADRAEALKCANPSMQLEEKDGGLVAVFKELE